MNNIKQIPFWPTILVIIGISIMAWFFYKDSLWEVINDQYIEKIKVDGKRVSVVLKDKEQLSQICDLKVFNGLKPVKSLNEAVELYGDPDNYIPEKDGIQKIEYWFENSRVDFIRQVIASEEVFYTVKAYPTNLPYNKLFYNVINYRIDGSQEKTLVVIIDSNDDLLMVITLEGERVYELAW
jgi:hypothetical protein